MSLWPELEEEGCCLRAVLITGITTLSWPDISLNEAPSAVGPCLRRIWSVLQLATFRQLSQHVQTDFCVRPKHTATIP